MRAVPSEQLSAVAADMNVHVERFIDELGLRNQLTVAAVVQAAQRSACTVVAAHADVIQHPTSKCQCGSFLHARLDKECQAAVLDTDGWQLLRHVPVRCRNPVCHRRDKYVWYNYVAVSATEHVWSWDGSFEMKYFFTVNTWGVTAAWLRQHTQRLALQYVAFEAEAAVHRRGAAREGNEQIIPDKEDRKMLKAWMCWRVVGTTGGKQHVYTSPYRCSIILFDHFFFNDHLHCMP